MLGTDARLYGYAQTDGPTATGTIYRFDPLAGGPPSDPLSFTVLHTFPPEASSPSGPTLSADGFLYGTTRSGGATGRGRVYRLSRETGAVTLLGTLPGGPAQTASWNSPLVAGADGLLYGTSHSETDTVNENRIVRVDPATGTASAAHERTDPRFPSMLYASGPLARLSGALFGLRFERRQPACLPLRPADERGHRRGVHGGGRHLFADVAARGNRRSALPDFGLCGVARSPSPSGHDAQLRRVNLAAGTVDLAVGLGTCVHRQPSGPGAGRHRLRRRQQWLRSDRAAGRSPDAPGAAGVHDRIAGLRPDAVGRVRWHALRHFRVPAEPSTAIPRRERRPSSSSRREIGCVAEPFTTVPLDGLSYGAASFGGPTGGRHAVPRGADLAPPALDSDTDGLSNIWESAYGLDPFSSAGDAGAAGDPDQDGRTNAQELADGTHPRGTSRATSPRARPARSSTRDSISATRSRPLRRSCGSASSPTLA